MQAVQWEFLDGTNSWLKIRGCTDTDFKSAIRNKPDKATMSDTKRIHFQNGENVQEANVRHSSCTAAFGHRRLRRFKMKVLDFSCSGRFFGSVGTQLRSGVEIYNGHYWWYISAFSPQDLAQAERRAVALATADTYQRPPRLRLLPKPACIRGRHNQKCWWKHNYCKADFFGQSQFLWFLAGPIFYLR